MRDWKAAWLRERLKGSVTAWAVCVWKEVLFKTHQSLLCRIVLDVNQTWRPVLWLFTWKFICDILKLLTWLGQPLALLQIREREKKKNPKRKQKCPTVITLYDTSKRVRHIVSTDNITRHVWKSCYVLLLPMISHHTSKRVVTRCQYRYYHTTRLKELWRVISTDDVTPHVWKSCDVLSVRMISHNHVKRCSGLPL